MQLLTRLLLVAFTILSNNVLAVVKTSVNSGNWNTAATWAPAGVPGASDDVIIQNGHSPIVNVNTATCKSLTIQQGGTINILIGKKLIIQHISGLTVNGTLNIDQGEISIVSSGTAFTIGATGQVTWNPGENTLAGATLFTNCTENFAPTSTLIIKKWYNTRVGLGSVITGNFGNVTIQNINGWRMNNSLQTHQVTGTLTLTSSYVILDTTGAITSTTIGNINLTNSTALLDIYKGNQNISYTLNTGNINIAGGEMDLNYGSGAGICSLLVAGNISISNYGYLIGANGSNTNIYISVTGDVTLTRSYFFGVWSGSGNATININNNLTTLKSGNTYSEFYGIVDGNGNAAITVNRNFSNQGYANLIWNTGVTGVGNGNGTMKVNGKFIQSDGDFRGIWNATTTTAGHCTITIDSLLFSGGIFMGTYSCSNTADTTHLIFPGLCSIQFINSSDIFRGIGMATLSGSQNAERMRFTSSGNFEISGNASAEFSSSYGYGTEINIHSGTTTIAGGMNKFGGSPHTLSLQTGDMTISGGNSSFSYHSGAASLNFTSFTQQAGTVNLKQHTGSCNLTIQNNFTQSGGLFNMYNNLMADNTDSIVIRAQGNFLQTGGNYCFSQLATLTGNTILKLETSTTELGGTGILTSAGAGTSNHFGIIQLTGSGLTHLMNLKRSSTGHQTQQVKYHVKAGANVTMTGGTFQLSSHTVQQEDMLKVDHQSVLNADTTTIISNSLYNNCGIMVYGVLRTKHKNGIYDGSSHATFAADGNLNYYLDQHSKVIYAGQGRNKLSGYGYNGKTSDQHKYGYLEIFGADLIAYLDHDNYVRHQTEFKTGDLDPNSHTFYSGLILPGISGSGIIFDQNQSVIQSKVVIGEMPPYGNGFTIGYIPIKDDVLGCAITMVSAISNSGNSLLTFGTRATSSTNLPLPGADHVSAVTRINPNGTDNAVTNIIDRYYEIDAPGINANYSLIYFGRENTTVPAVSTGNISVQHWNGTSWQSINTTDNGDTSSTNHYSVSFKASNLSGPLIFSLNPTKTPVTLLSFTVTAEETANRCAWTTATEKNNDYFIVERSTDQQTFTETGRIPGAGQSTSVRNYTFYDQNPPEEITYYRLKQVDYEGKPTYSYIVSINRAQQNGASGSDLQLDGIYPNPFHEQFTIRYHLRSEGNVKFRLFDAKGRLISEKEEFVLSGEQTTSLTQLEQLITGTYMLHVIKGTEKITQKIIKSAN